MGFFQDFKKFISRGNVMDMAVGVVVGGAFSKIVTSLVADLITPLISLATKGVSLAETYLCLNPDAVEGQVFNYADYPTVALAKEAGYATLNYGNFIQNIINFLIIAFCVFLFVKFMTRLMPKKEAAPAKPARLCPYCKQPVHDEAVKCQHCASDIAGK